MLRLTAIIAVGLLNTPHLAAHELNDNRATMVLRDKTHLTITMFINYAEALHQALMPQRQLQEFLLMYSAMRPQQLQMELLRAQEKFQATTKVFVSGGLDATLTNWVWPDLKQVQMYLQQRVMQAMVDPAAHAHLPPLEIHADANTNQEITSVKVQFPAEFQRVLVVAYKPTQVYVERKAISGPIKF